MELNQIDWTLMFQYVVVGLLTAAFFGYLLWQMGKNPDNHDR